MSVIRVNPASIHAYSRDASQRFEHLRGELEALMLDVVAVPHTGPNAQAFTTQAGQLAARFADALIGDVRGVTEAIRASTANIAAALGGGAIVIEFDGSPVTAPDVPATTDADDLDTATLEALRPVVTARFASLHETLEANLASLEATDWEGQAKRGAVDAVTRLTASARAKVDAGERELAQVIDQQVDATLAADG